MQLRWAKTDLNQNKTELYIYFFLKTPLAHFLKCIHGNKNIIQNVFFSWTISGYPEVESSIQWATRHSYHLHLPFMLRFWMFVSWFRVFCFASLFPTKWMWLFKVKIKAVKVSKLHQNSVIIVVFLIARTPCSPDCSLQFGTRCLPPCWRCVIIPQKQRQQTTN